MKTLRDEAITQLILTRLSQDQRTYGQTIDVSVADGEIALIGWCDSEDQKIAASMIAQGTYGVRSVVDNVRVRQLAQSI